ncbi:MAG TPA: hypothetical protein VH640_02400 [Bryobacteraceae bacterium]
MKYTEPRYTKDLDVWIGNSQENSAKLYRALAKFGAPLANDGIDPQTFTEDDLIYQIGVPPARIDILTHITGVTFEDAWKQRVPSMLSPLSNLVAMAYGTSNYQISGPSWLDEERLVGKEGRADGYQIVMREDGTGRPGLKRLSG